MTTARDVIQSAQTDLWNRLAHVIPPDAETRYMAEVVLDEGHCTGTRATDEAKRIMERPADGTLHAVRALLDQWCGEQLRALEEEPAWNRRECCDSHASEGHRDDAVCMATGCWKPCGHDGEHGPRATGDPSGVLCDGCGIVFRLGVDPIVAVRGPRAADEVWYHDRCAPTFDGPEVVTGRLKGDPPGTHPLDAVDACGHRAGPGGFLTCAKPKGHGDGFSDPRSTFHETAGGTEFTNSGKVGLGKVGNDFPPARPADVCSECGGPCVDPRPYAPSYEHREGCSRG